MRPGRFDRRVVIDRPELDRAAGHPRGAHARTSRSRPTSNLADIARNTPGFSGADLANLVNEAALSATRRGADSIAPSDFSAAFDKIVLGDPREASLDGRREAPRRDPRVGPRHRRPLHAPRRAAAARHRSCRVAWRSALTQQNLAEDRHLRTQPELEAKLCVLLGGYAAERARARQSISSGAENDLKQATELAYKMVAHYGMSEEVGPVYHEHHTEHPFLGQTLATEGGVSDATVHAIENEARRILGRSLEHAKRRITENRDTLDRLVDVLLEQESIEGVALFALLGEPAMPRPSPHVIDGAQAHH